MPPLKPLTENGKRVRSWLIALGALGALLPALWSSCSVIDSRYVHRDEYLVQKMLDSINNVTTQTKLDIHGAKLDSLLARMTQIQCGAKVSEGCR